MPDRVVAVSVGVLWGRKHRENRPELLPVTGVGMVVAEITAGDLIVERRELLEAEDLKIAAEHLIDIDLPIITYNGLRFDWVALGSIVEVDELIPRTIDIYSSLYRCAAEIVDAEGVSGFPVSGDYGVLHPQRVAETNIGHVPGSSEDSIGEAELALALWHHFATYERAVIAGRTRSLDAADVALLSGSEPAFSNAERWREMLASRPEPRPYRRRDRHQITFPRVDQRYV
ncbi:MAG: hypothetical protein ACPGWS_06560 [Solirubrobacterales bacterium]